MVSPDNQPKFTTLVESVAERKPILELLKHLKAAGYDFSKDLPIRQFFLELCTDSKALEKPKVLAAVRGIKDVMKELDAQQRVAAGDAPLPGQPRTIREYINAGLIRPASIGSVLYSIRSFFRDMPFTENGYIAAARDMNEGNIGDLRAVHRTCLRLVSLGILQTQRVGGEDGYALTSRYAELDLSALLKIVAAPIGTLRLPLGRVSGLPDGLEAGLSSELNELLGKLGRGEDITPIGPPQVEASTIYATGDLVHHNQLGVGKVKFFVPGDAVYARFPGGDSARVPVTGETASSGKMMPNEWSGRILNKELLERWGRSQSHMPPGLFNQFRPLIDLIKQGEVIEDDSRTRLNEALEIAEGLKAQEGKTIEGLSVMAILLIDREINRPEEARMVPLAERIYGRFSHKDFSIFVHKYFEGNQLPGEYVAKLAQQQLRYLVQKNTRGTNRTNYSLDDLVDRAAAHTAWNVTVFHRLAANLEMTGRSQPSTGQPQLSAPTDLEGLKKYIAAQLHDDIFDRSIDRAEARYKNSLMSAEAVRKEVLICLRQRWSQGKPIHSFAIRKSEDSLIFSKAKQPFAFSSYAGALRAAKIPEYFIREKGEGENFQSRNAGTMEYDRCVRELAGLVNGKGIFDAKELNSEPRRSLFVSTYQYFQTLLDAGKTATGKECRMEELPELDIDVAAKTVPPEALPQWRTIFASIRSFYEMGLRKQAIVGWSEVGGTTNKVTMKVEEQTATINIQLQRPNQELSDTELYFTLLRSRAVPRALRRYLLKECLPSAGSEESSPSDSHQHQLV